MQVIVKPDGATRLRGITQAALAAMDTPALLAEQERVKQALILNRDLGIGESAWWKRRLRREHHVLKSEGLRIAAELTKRK